MLKTYEPKLYQSEIEFLDSAMTYMQSQLYPEGDPMRAEILELRLKLNAVLTCETPECDGRREGLEDKCGDCLAAYEDARRLYQGQPHYSKEELEDAYSHPTDRHKLMSLTGEYK